MASVPVLPYGQRAARWHATERARLANAGQSVPFADGQIAATASVNDAILVTANRKHFDFFEGLPVGELELNAPLMVPKRGLRTSTPLRELDPESSASTNSATSAMRAARGYPQSRTGASTEVPSSGP